MLAKRFNNAKLGIELTSYIDNKQNIWFQGKDIAKILGYSDTDQAIRKQVDEQDKYKGPVVLTDYSKRGRPPIFINESGFYSLVLSSKLETAKKFKKWVTSQVLPSIRKFGYYKLFDNPNNKMFKIANEMDLHCKVVQLMRNYYPDAIMVAGLGENQDTAYKRIISWKKGYLRGQPDLMILNYHKDFHGLCIEFKSPNISKPRHVFVFGIDTARIGSQTANPFLYDTFNLPNNAKISRCYLEVANGNEYPDIHFKPSTDMTRVFRNVMSYVYANNDYQGGTLLNRTNFENLFPFVYFDLTKQKMDIKDGVTKLAFHYELSANPNANYNIYALVLHERIAEISQPDGKLLLRA